MTFVVIWLLAIGYTLLYMGVQGFGTGTRPSFADAIGLSSSSTGTQTA